MRRFLMLLVACMVLRVSATPAEIICPDPDLLVGLFENGDINMAPAVSTPFNMYLVLLNPSHENLDAFEFKLTTPSSGTLFTLQEYLPPGAINLGSVTASSREYIVGLPYPQPIANQRVSLVTLTMMSLTNTPNQDFSAQLTTWPSIAGHIAYNVTNNGVATLVPMTPVSGAFSLPIARLYPQTPLNYCSIGTSLTELRIDIATTAGALADPLTRAGTTARATDGFDPTIESPEPTPPPGNYLCTSFEHSNWLMGPRFSSDMRAPFDVTQYTRAWPLLVETDQNGPVTLTFTPSFSEADNIGLQLRDIQTGQIYSLYPQLSYTYQNYGLPTYRRFELLVGALSAPALNPAQRSMSAGWSLVSLPLAPPVAGNTIGASMLSQAPGYSWVYTYSRAAGYQSAAATSIATVGTGYWLGTTIPYLWTMNGGERAINGKTIPLTPGWNLVGNPNWFVGNREGIRVVRGANTYTWTAAAQAGLVSIDLQGYDTTTGAYVDATTVLPWQAYWVNALVSDVSLRFYWPNFTAKSAATPEPLAAMPPTLDVWRTDLTLTDATGSPRTVTIGVDGGATDGFDAIHDRPQPPASPQGGPTLCLPHPEWGLDAGSGFTRDIVAPTSAGLAWTMTMAAPVAGPATLSWDSTGWPAGLDLQLYIPGENRVAVMSMRAQSSVVVDLGPAPRTVIVRTPDMISGTGDLPSVANFELSVHPNPFNPRTTVSFALPQAGNAEVRIYSVRGELVDVLGGHAYAAGRHEEDWNGVDRRGRDMPSGAYFGRLWVDGQPQGAIIRMSLVR